MLDIQCLVRYTSCPVSPNQFMNFEEGQAMLTLKVHNMIISWPKDIALIMMRYYKKLGVPFELQRHNIQNDQEFTLANE